MVFVELDTYKGTLEILSRETQRLLRRSEGTSELERTLDVLNHKIFPE